MIPLNKTDKTCCGVKPKFLCCTRGGTSRGYEVEDVDYVKCPVCGREWYRPCISITNEPAWWYGNFGEVEDSEQIVFPDEEGGDDQPEF
jgi:hypothetical protein